MDTERITDTYFNLSKKELFNSSLDNGGELHNYFRAQRRLLDKMYPELMNEFEVLYKRAITEAEKDYKFYCTY